MANVKPVSQPVTASVVASKPKGKVKAAVITAPLPPVQAQPVKQALNCSKCGQGRLTTEVRKNLGGQPYCKGCYYPTMHAAGLSPRWTALQANIKAAEIAAVAAAAPVEAKKGKVKKAS